LFVLGLIRPRAMEREGRPLLSRVRPGPSGALLLGMAFAAGWTPCIGPILGGILVLAYNQATLGSGIALLLLYSLGLGIPFVLAASFVDRFQGVAGWLSRRAVVLNAAGGVLLIGMGVLVFFDRLNQVLAPALEMYTRLRWPPI
jgi:cytochrome c-type biogenesis protein